MLRDYDLLSAEVKPGRCHQSEGGHRPLPEPDNLTYYSESLA